MPYLSGFTIIIIDFPEAFQLRERLSRAGATVHVVSPGGALILARHKRIDAAFIGFDLASGTHPLREALRSLGVRQIIVTAGDCAEDRLKEERRRGMLGSEPPHVRPANAPDAWRPGANGNRPP
jgi:hypothetical protein